MVTKMTHASIFVHDQEEALKFYRDLLGMEIRADFGNEGFRWLSVGPKSQPGFEIVLMAAQENAALSSENAQRLREVLESGQMSIGVLESDDVLRDYEAWSKQGVRFAGTPSEDYGMVSVRVYDPSGNSFNLTQPRR
jgi:catechol 2,3-dioxygenase-like lactoylglutathione lyase family enzyme